MSKPKKTVPIDDDLLGLIAIAARNDAANLDQHHRVLVAAASYRWLLKNFAASEQFTQQQQQALKNLIAALDAYQREEP